MKFLIVTGGSGGHVIPANVFYQYLKEKDYSVDLAIDTRGSKFLNCQPTHQWNSYGGGFLMRSLKILFYTFKTFFLVKKYDAIVGFGTYHSIPFLINGIIWRKKIYLHEQNTTLSRVNNIFKKFAHHLMVTWPLNYGIPTVHVGMPIRPYEKNKNYSFKILITLGSQEAPLLKPFINKLLSLVDPSIQKKITIISSPNNFQSDQWKVKYFETGFSQVVFDGKTQPVLSLYDGCSMAIGRGGAGFLYEMLLLKKPFITIPLHNSIGDHQLYNSQYAVGQGLGFLLFNEKDLENGAKFIENVYYKKIAIENSYVPKNSCKLMEQLIN
jgi:UDP-N-acetylglucosamine--N-acetylmuramyl-(pentapeptide) pyrophosphoryl-undecaprenol N-acetylglucosamine transferase